MSFVSMSTSEKIILNFAWEGPNTRSGRSFRESQDIRVIDLAFKGAKTDIIVYLPENISPVTPKKFSFTSREPFKETHLDSLSVTIEQVRSLVLNACVFEKERETGSVVMNPLRRIIQDENLIRRAKPIGLEIPKELELGQTYNIVVSSLGFSFSARLVKEESLASVKQEEDSTEYEFLGRIDEMRESLSKDRLQNQDLDLSGASDYSYMEGNMEDVNRGDQGKSPKSRWRQIISIGKAPDLDTCSSDFLLLSFGAASKEDRKLKRQYNRGRRQSDISELTRISNTKDSNQRFLMSLAEALRKKGIDPEPYDPKAFVPRDGELDNSNSKP